jgi:hypothetical protein
MTELPPGAGPTEPTPWAVLDIDGVLADVGHRLHHLDTRPKDWDGFFADAPDDPLLPEGTAVAARLAGQMRIVYLTGRPERCRHDTEDWLRRHGLPEGRLLMRPDRDRRPSRLYKLDQLRRLARQGPVGVLVDDDDAVVAAARNAGFAVLHADWAAAQPGLFGAQEVEGRT